MDEMKNVTQRIVTFRFAGGAWLSVEHWQTLPPDLWRLTKQFGQPVSVEVDEHRSVPVDCSPYPPE